MQKIDRLGWAANLSFTSYGLTIGIRTNDSEILGHFADRLPPGWSPTGARRVERLYSLLVGGASAGSGIRRLNLLYVNEMRLARSVGLPEVLTALESDLELYVAERARRRLFLHAGVVGWLGRAIVIPGESMSGKSSLVAALLGAGATYYSDEYAVLDSRGQVHAYPRALSLRDGSAAAPQAARPVAPAGSPRLAPLPVGLVVITRYRAGARWRPRLLSAGQAAIELLAHAVAARWQPARALAMLARALPAARAVTGVRGDATALVDDLLGALPDGWRAQREIGA